MITFLPFPEYDKSAKCLDSIRLMNQRREAKGILNVIMNNQKQAYTNPPFIMWRKYPYHLALYGATICIECLSRGFNDNQFDWFYNFSLKLDKSVKEGLAKPEILAIPSWLGDKRLHLSHQSNLLRKDRDWYSKFFNTVPFLNYYWPREG